MTATIRRLASAAGVATPAPAQRDGGRRRARRHLRTVALPRPRLARRRRMALMASVATLGLIAFGILFVHVRLAQSAFELQDAERKRAVARELRDELSLAVADLESPQRIRREATGRLGMVDPEVLRFLESPDAPTQAGVPVPTTAPPTTTPPSTSPPGPQPAEAGQEANEQPAQPGDTGAGTPPARAGAAGTSPP